MRIPGERSRQRRSCTSASRRELSLGDHQRTSGVAAPRRVDTSKRRLRVGLLGCPLRLEDGHGQVVVPYAVAEERVAQSSLDDEPHPV